MASNAIDPDTLLADGHDFALRFLAFASEIILFITVCMHMAGRRQALVKIVGFFALYCVRALLSGTALFPATGDVVQSLCELGASAVTVIVPSIIDWLRARYGTLDFVDSCRVVLAPGRSSTCNLLQAEAGFIFTPNHCTRGLMSWTHVARSFHSSASHFHDGPPIEFCGDFPFDTKVPEDRETHQFGVTIRANRLGDFLSALLLPFSGLVQHVLGWVDCKDIFSFIVRSILAPLAPKASKRVASCNYSLYSPEENGRTIVSGKHAGDSEIYFRDAARSVEWATCTTCTGNRPDSASGALQRRGHGKCGGGFTAGIILSLLAGASAQTVGATTGVMKFVDCEGVRCNVIKFIVGGTAVVVALAHFFSALSQLYNGLCRCIAACMRLFRRSERSHRPEVGHRSEAGHGRRGSRGGRTDTKGRGRSRRGVPRNAFTGGRATGEGRAQGHLEINAHGRIPFSSVV